MLIIFSCSKEASEDIGVDLVQPEPVAPVVKYQLSVTAAEGGTVSTSGGEFVSGSPITVTATPNSGYSFVNWTGDGSSTSSSFTFNLLSNTNLTANFQLIINSYNLVLSAGDGGTVSSEGGEFEEGSEITFSASPNEGFEFVEWSDGSTDIERTITINNDLSISAIFQLIEVKNVTLKFNGIGEVYVLTSNITNSGIEVINEQESSLIISNTNEDDSSTYEITLSTDSLYRFRIVYEPFQNDIQYNENIEEYFYRPNITDGQYITDLKAFERARNTSGKILKINYEFPLEEIDLTIKDVTTWYNDDIGGVSNWGLQFLDQTPRQGAVGLVNCAKIIDWTDGQLTYQNCFYSDYGPGGWDWKNNYFFLNEGVGSIIYSTINKGSEYRYAKIRYFDSNFQLLYNRRFNNLQYILNGVYNDLPVIYQRSGFADTVRSYIDGNPQEINPGVTTFANTRLYQLVDAKYTELTSSGEVTSTKTYLFTSDFLNNPCLGCGLSEITDVTLINENSGITGGAYSTNSYFRIDASRGWVQLGLSKFKFPDWNYNPGAFKGPIVDFDLSNVYRGEVFYTYPGYDQNKIFALSLADGNAEQYRIYLNVFNNSQLVYKKLIYSGPNTNNSPLDPIQHLKFRVWAPSLSTVIISSPYMKTMRIDGI